ncbi:MAG: MipA/OmpV family protein [Betaproteobacteria bacterium]|nr:MipA/OmpV family protein [Betaproteobacteria bacterium]
MVGHEPARSVMKRITLILGILLVWSLAASRPFAAPLDPMFAGLVTPGGAGLGVAVRTERSPYRDVEARYDLLPLYLYEGEWFYLHSYRAGFKVPTTGPWSVDLFVAQRFEGFPLDGAPAALSGMASREPGVDGGLGVRYRLSRGVVLGEIRRDVAATSYGTELRLGYFGSLSGEHWSLTPYVVADVRDAKLNDYYYGVRPEEARPGRPATRIGYGTNVTVGVNGRYELTRYWTAIAGVGVTRLSDAIRQSPIVGNDALLSVYLGAAYDFTRPHREWEDRAPVIVKAMVGGSTGCNLLPVMTLRCFSLHTPDRTRIVSLELGRPFVVRANDWPLDFVGYVGVLQHDERGLQADSWQIDAYMKAYYYGFPWADRVMTRIGFGAGVSWASRVPYVEVRDQAARGRTTSKLLNYLDPSVDVSVGDLFGSKRWARTFWGIGVSHRSGIFGTSQLLGNVNGGSNFIYSYLESAF